MLNCAKTIGLPYQINTTLDYLILKINKTYTIVITTNYLGIEMTLVKYYMNFFSFNIASRNVNSDLDEIISYLVYMLAKYNIEISQ